MSNPAEILKLINALSPYDTLEVIDRIPRLEDATEKYLEKWVPGIAEDFYSFGEWEEKYEEEDKVFMEYLCRSLAEKKQQLTDREFDELCTKADNIDRAERQRGVELVFRSVYNKTKIDSLV